MSHGFKRNGSCGTWERRSRSSPRRTLSMTLLVSLTILAGSCLRLPRGEPPALWRGGGASGVGAPPAFPFVFDNEKRPHPVPLRTFRIARAPVTNAEYASFVE